MSNRSGSRSSERKRTNEPPPCWQAAGFGTTSRRTGGAVLGAIRVPIVARANDLRQEIAQRLEEAIADPRVELTGEGLVHVDPDSYVDPRTSERLLAALVEIVNMLAAEIERQDAS